MPTFSVSEEELVAMLGAHRDRYGVLRITAARLSASHGTPLRPENVQVSLDPEEKRVTISWPDTRPAYSLTLDIEPDRPAD